MMLDFEEHMFHRRIMQRPFARTHSVGYVGTHRPVVTAGNQRPGSSTMRGSCSARPSKELTLDIASMVYIGHEPAHDHELVTKVTKTSPPPPAP